MGLRSSLCKVIKLCSVTFNMFILSLLEFPSFISYTFHYMYARLVKMGVAPDKLMKEPRLDRSICICSFFNVAFSVN
jgi:hypothetical protein